MDNEIAKVSGRVDFFLGLRFRHRLTRLVLGAWLFAWVGLILAIAILTTVFMGSGLLSASDDLTKAAGWTGYLAAMVACGVAYNRVVTRKFRQRWAGRGIPADVEISFVAATDGLHISSETGKSVVHWPYLSEIDLVGDYWLVIGPGWALPLPRSFFATPAEERAFLVAVLERMTPAARTRSSKATKLVLQA